MSRSSWNFAAAVPGGRSNGDENSGFLGSGTGWLLRRGHVRSRRRACNRAPVRRERSSRRCVLELGESHLGALRHDEVALPLVARERLLERLGCLLRAVGELQHLGEVGARVALSVEHVCVLAGRHA